MMSFPDGESRIGIKLPPNAVKRVTHELGAKG